MSKKCKAYSESKLGLEPPDNRKAFYAGWDAALAAEQPKPEPVAYFDLQKQVFFWAKPTQIDVPMTVALEPLPLYPAPPENEALRRDAERYRWLRDKAPPDIGDMASVRDSHDPFEIDAAIDAAMEDKR